MEGVRNGERVLLLQKKLIVVFFLGYFCLMSCGSSTSTTSSVPSTTQQTTQSDSIQKSESAESPNAQSLIAFDVVGGMFKTSNSVSAQTLQPMSKNITTEKLTINQPMPQQVLNPAQSFTVDTNFNFVGLNGVGRLVVTAFGSGQEISTIRYFSPLSFKFFFFRYAFKNDCLGKVYLNGEIDCDINGDYKTDSQNFVGSAHCFSGPKEKSESLLYITDKKTHEVNLDAKIQINGNYLSYSSYTYQGTVTIDGIQKQIEELLNTALSCS